MTPEDRAQPIAELWFTTIKELSDHQFTVTHWKQEFRKAIATAIREHEEEAREDERQRFVESKKTCRESNT